MPPRAPNLPPPPRPVVFVALAVMAGQATGFLLRVPAALATAAGLACLGTAAWRFWRARRIHGPAPPGGLTLLAALGLLACAQAGWIAERDCAALAGLEPWTNEGMVCVEGTLADEPRVAPDHVELILESVSVGALRVGGGAERLGLAIAVGAVDEAAAALGAHRRALPLPGQRVRAWGRLRAVPPPSTPGPFDPQRAALGRGIGARLSVSKTADLEFGVSPRTPRAIFYAALRQLRAEIVAVLESRLTPEQMPMARALLLGDAHLVSTAERDAYTLTGLAHILAVSGLNTAFVLFLIIGLSRVAFISPRGSAWIGLAGVVLYAALTGFAPPVARAAVMGAFILGGYLLKRVTTPLASLAASALVTLLIDPRNLTRVDWQLSYGCVLSTIVLAAPLSELMLRPFRRDAAPGEPPQPPNLFQYFLQKWILLPLATLFAVQLGILPFQIEFFRQYNLLSPLFNLLCLDLSLLVMLGVGVTALLGWIPGLGVLAALPTRAGLATLSWLVGHMAAIPHVTLMLVPFSAPVMILYYMILLGGSWLRPARAGERGLDGGQFKGLILGLALLFAVIVWSQVFTAPGPNRRMMDLYVLDVGQGDSLVTRFPNGKVMVIDAGPAQGAADRGRLTVAPFLKTLGVVTIDCLIASHADADHIGGIPYLLDHFGVGLMLEGPDEADSDLFRSMRALERSRAVHVERARQGFALAGLGEARARLLGPVPGLQNNNASVIVLLEYRGTRIVLTGDLEAAGEHTLIAEGLGEDVDVLKLGHHGSRSSTSEEMLAVFKPEAALISVGAHNRYGHPSPVVLGRLAAHQVQGYRTDQLGTLWIRTDGKRIRIYHYLGE